MKNFKNIAVLILSLSLATAGATGVAVLATEKYVLAQSLQLLPVQTNTAQKVSSSSGYMTPTRVQNLSSILGTITLFIGIFTYIFNNFWKRRQYLDEKIKEFEEKAEVINVRKMLANELQCIELFPFLEKSTFRFVIIEKHLWAEALLDCVDDNKLKMETDTINELKECEKSFSNHNYVRKAAVRDNFNRFLDCLQQFEEMLELRLVSSKHLKIYLNPWFKFIEVVKDKDNDCIVCSLTNKRYSIKEVLIEYMGLSITESECSVVQKDVRKLVKRIYPSLIPKSNQQNNCTVN